MYFRRHWIFCDSTFRVRGSILFTTRTEHVALALALALARAAGERHEVVEVPLLSVDDGVELFLGHFADTKNRCTGGRYPPQPHQLHSD